MLSGAAAAGDYAAYGYQLAGGGGALVSTPDGAASVRVPAGWVWRVSDGDGDLITMLTPDAPDKDLARGETFKLNVPICGVRTEPLPPSEQGLSQDRLNERTRGRVTSFQQSIAAYENPRSRAFSMAEVVTLGAVDGLFFKQGGGGQGTALVNIAARYLTPGGQIEILCTMQASENDPPYEQNPANTPMEAAVRSLTFAP